MDQVKAIVEASTGTKFSKTFVYSVMHDYGMKYKKIQTISIRGNSNRSLILR